MQAKACAQEQIQEVIFTDINDLNESLKMFLVDNRAERQRLSERKKRIGEVVNCAYKLQRAVEKLIELDRQEQGGENVDHQGI